MSKSKSQTGLEYVIIIGGIIIFAAASYFILKSFSETSSSGTAGEMGGVFDIYSSELEEIAGEGPPILFSGPLNMNGSGIYNVSEIEVEIVNTSELTIHNELTKALIESIGGSPMVIRSALYMLVEAVGDLILNPTGNVGIKTSSPSSELDVNGTVTAERAVFDEADSEANAVKIGDGSDYLSLYALAGITYLKSTLGILNFGDDNLTTTGMVSAGKFSAINEIDEFSTDGTMGDNSDTAVPTEKAVKAYADSKVNDSEYNESWDGNTEQAPSQDAVYDKINSKVTEDSGAPTSTPNAVGDVYVDTDTLSIYIAGDTAGSYSWAYVGKAQASAFTKESVTGLIGWFDAGVGITKDGGDSVTGWSDRSDAANHLTSTSVIKPVWYDDVINGLPAVFANGASVIYTDIPDYPFPTTVFVVFKPTNIVSAGLQTIIELNQAGNARAPYKRNELTTSAVSNGVALEGETLLTNRVDLFTSIINGANSLIQRNDNTPTTGNAGTTRTNNNRIMLFRNSGASEPFYGYVAEVLIYNSALTEANQDIVRNYLNNKYAIW